MSDAEVVKIYGLVDPRDNALRYVGSTTTTLEQRLGVHCSGGANPQRRAWIECLKGEHLRPEIFEIETVPFAQRDASEKFWIQYFRFVGCDLLNSRSLRDWDAGKSKRQQPESAMEAIEVGGEEYIWVTSLAGARGIHQRSVYLAIDNGHLPSIKTPCGCIWVRRIEAEKWFPKSGPGRPKKQPLEAHGPAGSGRE